MINRCIDLINHRVFVVRSANMKFRFLLFCTALTFLLSSVADASWEKITTSLYESQIHSIAIDPTDSATIYVGVRGSVYRTTNSGEKWKRLLKLSSMSSVVRTIHVSHDRPGVIFVGSDEGLHRGTNGGRTWESLFSRRQRGFFIARMPVRTGNCLKCLEIMGSFKWRLYPTHPGGF